MIVGADDRDMHRQFKNSPNDFLHLDPKKAKVFVEWSDVVIVTHGYAGATTLLW
jgi:hypothetical protein